MHYDITLTWTSNRPYLDFYFVPSRSPVYRYEQIRSEYLREHGIVLPMPNPSEWTCPVHIDEEMYIVVTFFSELDPVALQKQLAHALVPEFVDRIEVKPARFPGLGVVCSN
jgi:hypothetical protein